MPFSNLLLLHELDKRVLHVAGANDRHIAQSWSYSQQRQIFSVICDDTAGSGMVVVGRKTRMRLHFLVAMISFRSYDFPKHLHFFVQWRVDKKINLLISHFRSKLFFGSGELVYEVQFQFWTI